MNQLIYKSKDELFKDLAEFILKIGNESIRERGAFNFVLTGGSSPKTLYENLASTYKDALDWSKVFFFFGDERYVPADNENYNGLMAKKSILTPLHIAEDHMFFVDTTQNPADAAKAYQDALFAHFNEEIPSFDLIILGMGDEAHTASMFPDTDIIKNEKPEVVSVYVEKLSAYRVSFTAPLINRARNIAFLVFGTAKAEAVKEVVESSDYNPMLYPAQLIKPEDGNLTWFMDTDAASLLNK